MNDVKYGPRQYMPVRSNVVFDAATKRDFVFGSRIDSDWLYEWVELRPASNQQRLLWVCPWVSYTQRAQILSNEIVTQPNERLIDGDGYFVGNGEQPLRFEIGRLYGTNTYPLFEVWNKDTAADKTLDAMICYRRLKQ